MKTRKMFFAAALTLALSLVCLSGCGGPTASNPTPAGSDPVQQLSDGGTLWLKVNPQIAIDYDSDGLVTSVTAHNDDALQILAGYSGFQGKETRQVVSELVTAIGEAGYFVEEIEGEARQITLEIESGSRLPSQNFLNDVVADVQAAVSGQNWSIPSGEAAGEVSAATAPLPQVNTVVPQGTQVYSGTGSDVTDYVDTDYGPGNDGVTDYNDTDYGPNNDGVTDFGAAVINPTDGTVTVVDTDYGPDSDGVTDYDDTDYGPNNDGVTDFGAADINPTDGTVTVVDTDYGPDSDGVTDYDDTDYGPNADGVTDYDDTDYGPNADGVTDYNDTDYGPNSDGVTDYDDTDYGPNADGVTDYNDSSSNYGSSDYADSSSSYGDSGYDD